MACLKQESSHASHFALLFNEDFKVLVNDGDSQQNTCSWANGTYEETNRNVTCVRIHLILAPVHITLIYLIYHLDLSSSS